MTITIYLTSLSIRCVMSFAAVLAGKFLIIFFVIVQIFCLVSFEGACQQTLVSFNNLFYMKCMLRFCLIMQFRNCPKKSSKCLFLCVISPQHNRITTNMPFFINFKKQCVSVDQDSLSYSVFIWLVNVLRVSIKCLNS